MFYALEPSSQYEVVIQSQNRWGWSENSDPFFFSTRANGKYHITYVLYPFYTQFAQCTPAMPINRGLSKVKNKWAVKFKFSQFLSGSPKSSVHVSKSETALHPKVGYSI